MPTLIDLTGNLATDPELAYSKKAGTPYVRLTIYTTDRAKKDGQWADDPTSTTRYVATARGRLAENLAATVKKGDRIHVTGSFRERTYTKKDGTETSYLDVTVTKAGPSLEYATATITRNPKTTHTDTTDLEPEPLAFEEDPW
jgi:single-strand DNA-binding protein